jgi:hypothetical protein
MPIFIAGVFSGNHKQDPENKVNYFFSMDKYNTKGGIFDRKPYCSSPFFLILAVLIQR